MITYAGIYDRLVLDYPGEIPFYRDIASMYMRREGRILVAPCVTGKLAIFLARAGFDCVGVDLDPAMVAIATQKRSQLPQEVQGRLFFQVRDLRTLDGGKFDLILLPHRGMLCLRPEERKLVFSRIRTLLKDGGLLVFDVSERQETPLFRYNYQFTPCFVSETVLRSDDGGLVQELVVEGKGESERLSLYLWYPSKREIEVLLLELGFEILRLWGNFFQVPYKKGESQYQIWLCQKE